jgi:hypothetical protein
MSLQFHMLLIQYSQHNPNLSLSPAFFPFGFLRIKSHALPIHANNE